MARIGETSWKRPLAALVVVATIIAVAVAVRPYLDLRQLADHEGALRSWGEEHPWLVYIVAFAAYVVVTGLSIPGATVLSLTYAWYFGFGRALVLVSFASTSGATTAFLLSRYFFRDVLSRRFGEQFRRTDEALRDEGAFYLFVLRLTPVVPFFVVNAVMGLTSLRTRTFWWVSQLGMLPGTLVYIYAGASAPSLRQLADHGLRGIPLGRIAVVFFLLGCFPLAARWVVQKLRARNPPAAR